jgi:hypothetical protein
MEWGARLEAKKDWDEVETIEIGKFERWVDRLTVEGIDLTLTEGKNLLAERPRLVIGAPWMCPRPPWRSCYQIDTHLSVGIYRPN